MRASALMLVLSCAVGSVHAAPATDAQVSHVVQALGMDSLGASMARMMIDNVPALKALPDNDRACAAGPVRSLLDAEFRRQLVVGLGDDGDQVMAQWKDFLATPAGDGLKKAFGNANPETVAEKASVDLDPAAREALTAFLASPAFQRFIATLDQDIATPDDHGTRLAKDLQDQCRIALTPDQIS